VAGMVLLRQNKKSPQQLPATFRNS
jgi:hypothetical protein